MSLVQETYLKGMSDLKELTFPFMRSSGLLFSWENHCLTESGYKSYFHSNSARLLKARPLVSFCVGPGCNKETD